MDISLLSRSHLSFRSDEFSAMSKGQMQDRHEGEDPPLPRVVAKSGPARNLVFVVPALSSWQSSWDPVPMGLGRPEARCQSSNARSTGRPDASCASLKRGEREWKRIDEHGVRE